MARARLDTTELGVKAWPGTSRTFSRKTFCSMNSLRSDALVPGIGNVRKIQPEKHARTRDSPCGKAAEVLDGCGGEGITLTWP